MLFVYPPNYFSAESKEINTLMGYQSIQCTFTKNERVWFLND